MPENNQSIGKQSRLKPRPKTTPKLVNRGPAGLLNKVDSSPVKHTTLTGGRKRINYISQDLRSKGMVVSIGSLKVDPMNARIHPERNIESVKLSLSEFSQVKPIVVREEDRVVMAGNGTLQAAIELGWTEIAATFISMSDGMKAGYSLADNRTAELAIWDFPTVTMLEELARKDRVPIVGWTTAEVMTLRKEYPSSPQENPSQAVIGDQSDELEDKYHVIVDCKTEKEQLEVLKSLRKMRVKCKALVF